MAQDVQLITYANKVKGQKGSTNPIHNVNVSDMNELKEKFNNNAQVLANRVKSEFFEFTNATGVIIIDFTDDKFKKFDTPKIMAYNTEEGGNDKSIKGFSEEIFRNEDGEITSVRLDGVFWDGYISITN